ncbi:MAG: glycogen/starch synthase [Deltaproteobacteria bacterium]|nr:glycogen/starch synthase [Deltaproteobacteria bacterium]
MPLATFYFQLHQPFRLHPDRGQFLWEEQNRAIFLKVAEKCYLPATRMFTELIASHPSFKITLGMSGTFLEQAELYKPEVIQSLQALLDAGEKNDQVEYLDETYYHSLSSLFEDPLRLEFREQASLHQDMMKRIFGIVPTSFRNTELMYNNPIAEAVADMGYHSILCEKRDDMFIGEGEGEAVSPNAVFRAKDTNLIVIPRNRELSDDIAFRFPHAPITPETYAQYIARIDGEAVMLGYDFEHIGEHIWSNLGIFEFWRGLPAALQKHESIVAATPTEIAQRFKDAPCPTLSIHGLATSSWADTGKNTFGWLGNPTQYELFRDIERMETAAKRAGGTYLTQWRHLTTSDHVYFLHERIGEDHAVHAYFNPYDNSIARPTHVLTRKIDDLEVVIRRFEVLKKKETTAILIISPETGRLPEDMGALARFISGKSGGQGEVVSALCEGLTERGLDVHLAILNLKKRFQREAQMNEVQWREVRYKIDSDKIHLISSSIFSDNLSAYAGDPILTAVEFQREIVNNVIKTVRARSEGRMILHSHDWMAGGAITAYASATGLPVLHTVHNVFTACLPLDLLGGINLGSISDRIYFSEMNGKACIDCQATAIKNATMINFVGKKFLREVVEDYFLDRDLVPPSVRQEVKEKYAHDAARAIINAPSSQMYPERCEALVRKYGPDDDILEAKRENLVAFQKQTGLSVNPDALLYFWPSRLDPFQKGVELLEQICISFTEQHREVQIAIVADGIGNDRTHVDILGGIACNSGGRITCQPFNEELSLLGYAAACDVFGASLYEPCGQIDQVGNLFGATATNRNTGGYHDKIRKLRLKVEGAPQDVGNGFLFRDYDAGGLWYALEKSVAFHRMPAEIREKQLRRIMRESREQYSLDHMVAEYIRIYEKLNAGRPLA